MRWGGCRYEPVSKKLFGVVMLRDLQPGTEAELVKVCIHILTLADCLAVVPLSLIPRPLSALSLRSLTWYSFAIEKRDSVAFSMRCVCVCVWSLCVQRMQLKGQRCVS